MEDFKKLIAESDGPMDLANMRTVALFNTDEEPTLTGIVQKLICAANVIIDHRIAIGLGLETNKNAIFFNNDECNWILHQIAPMMKTVQQVKKIQAENVSDVIKQLSKGKMSISEAKELMELVAQKSAMDLLEELE